MQHMILAMNGLFIDGICSWLLPVNFTIKVTNTCTVTDVHKIATLSFNILGLKFIFYLTSYEKYFF